MDQPQSKLRCLVGARVSVVQGPQKVSNLAQLETGARWVAQHDGEVIGTFEDLGVSATVDPMDRPDLGPWLKDPERLHQWDALVFSKMDRAFRSTRHCVDLARFCEEQSKLLVFAEDGLTLDYRNGKNDSIESMMSELFVYIGSFFAQLELNRFKTRALDAHRTLRPTTRVSNGRAPFGYKVVPHPSGKGKGLAQDPAQQRLLKAMGTKLLEGESFTSITEWIRKEDKPTWSVQNVIIALTSPRTQGWKTTNQGKDFVLDTEGEPIRMADPTFDNDTWAQIQRIAQERKITKSRTHTSNPMLGLGFCMKPQHRDDCPLHTADCKREPGCNHYEACECPPCGKSLAQRFTRKIRKDGSIQSSRRYRCSRTPKPCNGTEHSADPLDQLVEEHFLDQYGDQMVTERTWQQGNDLAADLARVEQQIKRLRAEQAAGLVVTDEDHDDYMARMKALVDRRSVIQASEPRSPGWIYLSTGQTFREAWDGLRGPENIIKRRDLLISRGVRFDIFSARPLVWSVTVPDDSEE